MWNQYSFLFTSNITFRFIAPKSLKRSKAKEDVVISRKFEEEKKGGDSNEAGNRNFGDFPNGFEDDVIAPKNFDDVIAPKKFEEVIAPKKFEEKIEEKEDVIMAADSEKKEAKKEEKIEQIPAKSLLPALEKEDSNKAPKSGHNVDLDRAMDSSSEKNMMMSQVHKIQEKKMVQEAVILPAANKPLDSLEADQQQQPVVNQQQPVAVAQQKPAESSELLIEAPNKEEEEKMEDLEKKMKDLVVQKPSNSVAAPEKGDSMNALNKGERMNAPSKILANKAESGVEAKNVVQAKNMIQAKNKIQPNKDKKKSMPRPSHGGPLIRKKNRGDQKKHPGLNVPPKARLEAARARLGYPDANISYVPQSWMISGDHIVGCIKTLNIREMIIDPKLIVN
jgi:hypothetical protein